MSIFSAGPHNDGDGNGGKDEGDGGEGCNGGGEGGYTDVISLVS